MGKPRGGAPPPKRNGGGGGGESELHAAARSGDLQKVESICNSNPLAVNSRDKHSRTPYPLFNLTRVSFFLLTVLTAVL